ncbi:DUF4097 domain-containing protein [Streptomyces sp. A7024]|uniref:DUF4097 domain-containing protein n=1 Tax=Streptomyces coryli TaxID=1128680 RepID=A0A6G4TUI8_9ACTN|nr:DUF4097 family beta strand repeat-containing protein [Streptomyces coryli]NGN63432.1 DUF4097 domain-containing protein [Streptomyces coryli]
MPAFDFETPEPILATATLHLGCVRVTASDRGTATVTVRPKDSRDACDVATAGLARAEYAAGEMVISALRTNGLPGSGAVLIDIELPSDSRMHMDALSADFHSTGRLGESRISTGCGHIRLDRSGPAHLSSALGNVSAEQVAGPARIDANCGDVHIRRIDGTAELTRSIGNTRIDRVTGDVRTTTNSGDLRIDAADAGVEARAAQGDIRIGRTGRGRLDLETASGRIEVGLPGGIAVGLDLDSHVGTVYRSLDLVGGAAEAPGAMEAPGTAVQLRARTIIGDIVVRRVEPGREQEQR